MKTIYFDTLKLNFKNQRQLENINLIIEEYSKQGYRLTLRQLYYQEEKDKEELRKFKEISDGEI
jgi:hypothetical protein